MADDPTMSEVDDPQEVQSPVQSPIQAPVQPAPQIAPNPADGPGAFPDPFSYHNAFVQAAREAAQKRAEEDQFNQLIQQSSRTEDALKAVAAARRFIATRKLGNDYQKAVQAGLPHEQAWAQAAVQNLEAFGGNMAPVTAAVKASRPVAAPPPLGEVIPVNVPGGRTTYGTRTGPNTMQLLKAPVDEQAKLEKDLLKSHINNLQKQADSLAMAKDKDSIAVVADLNKQIEEGKRMLLGGSTSEPQKAMPMPKTKDKLEKGVVYQTPRGLARWNGDKFERVQ